MALSGWSDSRDKAQWHTLIKHKRQRQRRVVASSISLFGQLTNYLNNVTKQLEQEHHDQQG